MIGRVLEVAEDGRHLSQSRGFLVVQAKDETLGRVPLDDLGAVIANAHGLTYSNNLLVALAARNVALVLCGRNHSPEALLWPVEGYYRQTARMRAQVGASRPFAKRTWQTLVRAKIALQGAVLESRGRTAGAFDGLARKVRSGDPDNVEAQAARRYWPLLLGADFRRDKDEPGINGMLNYGYAVLRAATARAVMAAGLHPTFGLHHGNQGNPMALVDDLMEPFRPLVDLRVAQLVDAGHEEVDRTCKQVLAEITVIDLDTDAGATPLSTCLTRLAASLGQAFENGTPRLALPGRPRPLDLAPPVVDEDA